jgi:hypothetical protein
LIAARRSKWTASACAHAPIQRINNPAVRGRAVEDIVLMVVLQSAAARQSGAIGANA